ncbi:hypothetical protein [Candidatus Uabimicrobium sp. HlEnr_7]|uniref:hypothetical protein n=1 Tax=Candidatus Uabimicrobium helgolandensis TaxID=3095367 RepID=UPI00355917B5
MSRYFAMALFIVMVGIVAQEDEKKTLKELQKSNKELNKQLQIQNKLIQKLQAQFSQLEKKVELLTKKNKPISAKEKKELQGKIATHQKAVAELEKKLKVLNQNYTQFFIQHSILESFCKNLKDSDPQKQINLFLKKNSIAYTLEEEKKLSELFVSKFNYKFSIRDINLLGRIVQDFERINTAISRINAKGNSKQIDIEISFLKIDFPYIEKVLKETKSLISNIKSTKDMQNTIKKAQFSFSASSLERVINIFDITRKLPISVVTQLRIVPLETPNNVKQAKKVKPKAKLQRKPKISFTSIEKGREKLKNLMLRKDVLQKELQNTTHSIKKLEITEKIYKQLKGYQANTAKRLNQFIATIQEKPIVLSSLDILCVEPSRQKQDITYKWTSSFFYFATSLEPAVAFIDQLTFLDFSYKKPLHFKKSMLVGRKGYRFSLQLFPKTQKQNGISSN